MKIKTPILVAIIALLCVAVTAMGFYILGGMDKDEEKPVVQSATLANNNFIGKMHQIVPASMAVSDVTIINMGHDVCDAYETMIDEKGYISREMLIAYGEGVVQGAGGWMSYSDVGAMMGQALFNYCPEYTDEMESAIQEG